MTRAVRRPQAVAVAPYKTLAAIGDSLTFNWTLAVRPELFHPERLAVALRALDVPIKARNFGLSGNTTAQMATRLPALTEHDIPVLAVVWGGVNDPGNGIVGATTQANIEGMIDDLIAAGVSYVVVVNTQFLNYSTGGDTLVSPYTTYATLRPFQAAAVTSRAALYPGQVALCDLYTAMRNLIVAGTYAAGDFGWHVADANQHLNAAGEQIVADAVLATIQAQSGWVAALQRIGANR